MTNSIPENQAVGAAAARVVAPWMLKAVGAKITGRTA